MRSGTQHGIKHNICKREGNWVSLLYCSLVSNGWNTVGGKVVSLLSQPTSVYFQCDVMSQSEGENGLKEIASAGIRLIHNEMEALWSFIVDEPLGPFAQSLETPVLAHLLTVPHSG